MKIEIAVDFIVIRGEQKVGISSIQILTHAELPRKYTSKQAAVWGAGQSIIGTSNKGIIRTIMSEGDIMHADDFRRCMKLLKAAANQLEEVNKELNTENKGWFGSETFIL